MTKLVFDHKVSYSRSTEEQFVKWLSVACIQNSYTMCTFCFRHSVKLAPHSVSNMTSVGLSCGEGVVALLNDTFLCVCGRICWKENLPSELYTSFLRTLEYLQVIFSASKLEASIMHQLYHRSFIVFYIRQ